MDWPGWLCGERMSMDGDILCLPLCAPTRRPPPSSRSAWPPSRTLATPGSHALM